MSKIPHPADAESLESLAAMLDAATHDECVEWLYGVPMSQYWTLWDMAKGSAVSVDYFLYPEGDDRPRIHDGANTAPPFRHFQKRFARFENGVVGGYNHAVGLGTYVVWFQGYGPFIVTESDSDDEEAWIDYRTQPPQHADFPTVKPIRFTNYIVYGGMIDAMRRVSADITIGSSEAKGFPVGLGAKFMLVRRP